MILALEKAQLFESAESDDTAHFRLDALIKGQDQPSFGLDMTSSLLVKYTVTDLATGDEVWEDEVFTQFTAKFTSCCYAPIRLNKANEGVVRENFKKLVEQLAAQQW